jgi:4,5-dihydroxyphthalate decarboxylase
MTITKVDIRCEPYDYLYPLRRGDVDTDLDVSWFHRREWRATPTGVGDVSEASVSHVFNGIATGTLPDRVPIPIFMARGFRQRCFYVRPDSDLTSLEDLRGTTVVTNSWYDTGNTWSRGTLRERGVDLTGIRWLFAPVVSGAPSEIASPTGRMPEIDATILDGGSSTLEVLLSGAADAALIPMHPIEAARAGVVRRLLPDHKREEREYFSRVGVFPTLHTVTVDGALARQDPTLPRRVYQALAGSEAVWEQRALVSSGGPPWYAEAFEEMYRLFGPDFTFHGVDNAVNRATVETLIAEMLAQGHIDDPVAVEDIYPPFEQ